jgi:ribosomal protein S8E
MPALDTTLMKQTIVASLVAAGLVNYQNVNGKLVPTGTLAPNLDAIVNAIIAGISTSFEAWRAAQTVTGTATVTSAPGTAPVVASLEP